MKLWLIRHGQTDMNLEKRMQGLSDIPLNETGREQARRAAETVKDVSFDVVFASPLKRAVETASILSGFPEEKIIRDERLIEANFGKYEGRHYHYMGLPMTLYWALPEVFPAPRGVESIASMVKRSTSFIEMLEEQVKSGNGLLSPESRVLVSCHGGIIRALRGCLENRPNGIIWRPKPKNCEFRVYEYDGLNWNRVDESPIDGE